MNRKTIILPLLLILSITCFSQKNINVYTFDKITNQPIEFVTITKSETKEDTLKVTKITNGNGKAIFFKKADHLYLSISHINYSSLDTVININDEIEIHVFLIPASKTIEEVTVISHRKTIEPIVGGYTFNPDKKIIDVSRNTIELLKHLPGILQDRDGKLRLLGGGGNILGRWQTGGRRWTRPKNSFSIRDSEY